MIGSAPLKVQLIRGNWADLDDVMTIMTQAFQPQYGEAWTYSQCAGILPMSGVSLTLARDGKQRPLGFSLFRTVAGEAELLLLAVAPAYQRQGIAKRLLNEFIECAKDNGVNRVHLEVRQGNPAVALYQATGFEAVGRRRHYYCGSDGDRFDAVTFARDL